MECQREMECFIENHDISKCNLKKIGEIDSRLETKIIHHHIVNNGFFEGKPVLKCDMCSAVFLEGLDEDSLCGFYQNLYDESEYKGEIKALLKNKLLQFNSRFLSQVIYFLQFSRLKAGTRILEIGPNGQGILPTLKLFQKELVYYYYDQDESLVIQKYGGTRIGPYYFSGKTQLPKVDIIWMSHSLEHFSPEILKQCIADFHDCLNSEGLIFIEVPNEEKYSNYHTPHTLYFNRDFMLKFFHSNGFNVVSYSEIDRPHEAIEIGSPSKENSSHTKRLYSFLNKFPSFVTPLMVKLLASFALKPLLSRGPTNQQFDIIRVVLRKR